MHLEECILFGLTTGIQVKSRYIAISGKQKGVKSSRK